MSWRTAHFLLHSLTQNCPRGKSMPRRALRFLTGLCFLGKRLPQLRPAGGKDRHVVTSRKIPRAFWQIGGREILAPDENAGFDSVRH